jgi:hypothetical protein
MGKDTLKGFQKLIDDFPVGSTLSIEDIARIASISNMTARRVARGIPDEYIEGSLIKSNGGKPRIHIKLLKPFSLVDLKTWVVRVQTQERIDREKRQAAEAEKLKAPPTQQTIWNVTGTLETAYRNQQAIIVTLQTQVTALAVRIRRLEINAMKKE